MTFFNINNLFSGLIYKDKSLFSVTEFWQKSIQHIKIMKTIRKSMLFKSRFLNLFTFYLIISITEIIKNFF